MVIPSSLFEQLPDKYMLGFYYPEFIYDGDDKYDNDEFNCYSQRILDLKNHCSEAIYRFSKDISKILVNAKDIAITTPPTNSGIKTLAQGLSRDNKGITDLTDCFGRLGKREIYLNKNHSIVGRNIILLDDVVTSGETMKICSSELINAGAKKVKCIALGRTWRGIQDAYDQIEISCESNLKMGQQKLFKRFSNVGYEFQKSADKLIKIQPQSYNHDTFLKTLNCTVEEIGNIKLLVEEIEWSMDSFLTDLNDYRNEAQAVLEGENTFNYSNVLLQTFLW
jgi:hypothetical protein